LISEIKVIQAAPPTSITGESALKLCQVLIITITNPKISTPVDTMTCVDHLSTGRPHCKSAGDRTEPKASEQYPVSDCGLIHVSSQRRQQRKEHTGEEHDYACSEQYSQDRGRVADVANGGNSRSRQRFRRLGPLANRPVPPCNQQNDAEKRDKVHNKRSGDARDGYDYARKCRPNCPGEIEFDPVKR
jgi:hypothetical protein